MKKFLLRNRLIIFCLLFCLILITSLTLNIILLTKEPQVRTVKEPIYIYVKTPIEESEEVLEEAEEEKIYFNIPLEAEIQDYIEELCIEYNVPFELALAVIHTESNFKSDVISSTNDYGLMQINKINHANLTKLFGYTDFLDPKANCHCGIYMLSNCLNATNQDITKALMAYNRGYAGASKLWEQGIYSTDYTDKVNEHYNFYLQWSKDMKGV